MPTESLVELVDVEVLFTTAAVIDGLVAGMTLVVVMVNPSDANVDAAGPRHAPIGVGGDVDGSKIGVRHQQSCRSG